jgi:hypothetical protein
MIEKKKLAANGNNCADWVRTLRPDLRNAENKYVLETPLPSGIQKFRKHVMLVNKTASFKKKGKSKKSKGAGKTGSQSNSKGGAKNETKCFYCKDPDHWKRNCKKYLADKKSGKTGKGITVILVNVIEVLLASENSKSWVFDTGSVAHICNLIQGL